MWSSPFEAAPKGERERCRRYGLAVVDHLVVVATGGYSSTFLGGP
jgi:hypothetical protein